MKKLVVFLFYGFALGFLSSSTFAQVEEYGTIINGSENTIQAGASLDFSSSGDILAVGHLRTNAYFEDKGMAKVFELQNEEWVQLGNDIGNQITNDKGFHVSLNGSGTILAMSTGSNYGAGSIVSIYEFINDDWQLMGYPIDIDDGIAKLNDLGTTVVVSSSSSTDLQVFEYINNDWQLKGNTINNQGVFWGLSSDINNDGDIIAGIDFNGSTGGYEFSHSILIYKFENDQWNQIGEIETISFSIDKIHLDLNDNGNKCIISSFKIDNNDNYFIESKVYNLVNGNWIQIGNTIIMNPSEEFTYIKNISTISNDGSKIVIGNPLGDGQVKLFKLINNEWIQLGDGISGNGGDFGRAISFNEDATQIAIGSPKYSEIGNYFGQVKTYEINYELFSTEDYLLDNSIILSPNPVSDILYINHTSAISITSINIVDILGRKVYSTVNPTNSIDISKLEKGVLLVQIQTNKGLYTQKLIKQ